MAQLVAIEDPDRVDALVLAATGTGDPDPSSDWAQSRRHIAGVASEQGLAAARDAYL